MQQQATFSCLGALRHLRLNPSCAGHLVLAAPLGSCNDDRSRGARKGPTDLAAPEVALLEVGEGEGKQKQFCAARRPIQKLASLKREA